MDELRGGDKATLIAGIVTSLPGAQWAFMADRRRP